MIKNERVSPVGERLPAEVAPTRGTWTTPTVRQLSAASAESNASPNNVDGSFTTS